MKVGVLTKTGISFTSRPILQEASRNLGAAKVYKDINNPTIILMQLIDRLIISDIGKMKQRMTQNKQI